LEEAGFVASPLGFQMRRVAPAAWPPAEPPFEPSETEDEEPEPDA